MGLYTFKLDMAKVHNRVEWVFIERIMGKMGFDEKWIPKVMNCVKGASFSVIINGKPIANFTPTSGLRQGCSLSPYLFLICSEGLSCLVNNAADKGLIHGPK